MTIVESKHIEDCFDGSYVYELSYSEPITKAFIMRLGSGSKVQYFPEFPRPFFRIQDDRFWAKGIEGNTTLRIIAFEPIDEIRSTIEARTQQYQEIN